MTVVDLFAEAGELALEAGQLPDALAELSIRLELAGAGDLLSFITDRTCWHATTEHEECPRCGLELKGTPNPHPRPTPPPTPPPPPPPPDR